MIPFFVYSIANLLLYSLYGQMPVLDYTRQVLLNGWEGLALWFIPVFFISVLVARICCFSIKRAIISVLLLMVLGASLDFYNVSLPWTLSTVPFACVYMLWGFLLKGQVLKLSGQKSIVLVAVSVIGFAISLVISQSYRLDLAWNKVLPLIPLLIAALSGIFFLLSLSILIERYLSGVAILKYIGRHTYELLAFSQAIILILNTNFNLSVILKYLLLALGLWMICIAKDKANGLKTKRNEAPSN